MVHKGASEKRGLLFQILAAEIAAQRLIEDNRRDRGNEDFRHHVGRVVRNGPNRCGPAELVREHRLPDDPAGDKVAGKADQQDDNRADRDGGVTVFQYAVKARGKADDAEGNDVVEQDNGDGLPDVLRILDV